MRPTGPVVRTCSVCHDVHVEAHGVHLGCRRLSWGGLGLRLGRSEELLLRRLLLVPAGARLTSADLVDCIYGHREDGGPEWAGTLTRVIVGRLRAKLAKAHAPVQAGGRRQATGRGAQPAYWLEVKTAREDASAGT